MSEQYVTELAGYFFDMNVLEYADLLRCDTVPLDEWLQTIRKQKQKQKKNSLIFKDQAVQGECTFQDGGFVVGISNLSQTK